MEEALLRISNLHVAYQTDRATVNAVNGIDLELFGGEALGLVGETGAGKTTTALSIMQLLPERTGKITEGSIFFEGEDVAKLKEKELQAIRGNRISMIFQDPMTSLNPVFTVGRQIAEAVKYHSNLSDAEIEKQVDTILEKVGIPATRKGEYPHQFSGGMKQRVLIAMALSCNPKLLIADEPTTALDVTIQAQILQMMADLKNEFHTAVLLITHDLAIVAEVCDKVAVMYAGEIVEYGTVEEVFGPGVHHPYTEGLFNSIPSMEKGKNRLSPIEGLMPVPTDLPSGCKFHPRCRYKCDACSQCDIVLTNMDGSHMVRCNRFQEQKG